MISIKNPVDEILVLLGQGTEYYNEHGVPPLFPVSFYKLTESMEKMLNDCIDEKNLNILYTKYVLMENSTRHRLIEFEEKYPNVLSDKNIHRILKYAEKADEIFIEQIQEQMQSSQNQESDETK